MASPDRNNFKNYINNPEPPDEIEVELKTNTYDIEGVRNLVGTKMLGRFIEDGVPRTSAPMTYVFDATPTSITITQVIGGDPPYQILRDGEIIGQDFTDDDFPFEDTGLRQSIEYCYTVEDQNKDTFRGCALTYLESVASNVKPFDKVTGSNEDFFQLTLWLTGSLGGEGVVEAEASTPDLEGSIENAEDYPNVLVDKGNIRNIYVRSRRPEDSEGRIESFWGYVRDKSEQELPEDPSSLFVSQRPPTEADGNNGDLWVETDPGLGTL